MGIMSSRSLLEEGKDERGETHVGDNKELAELNRSRLV